MVFPEICASLESHRKDLGQMKDKKVTVYKYLVRTFCQEFSLNIPMHTFCAI